MPTIECQQLSANNCQQLPANNCQQLISNTCQQLRERAASEGVQTRAAPVTTSTNPTNLHVLREKRRTHMKHTRCNTPGATPSIIGGETPKRRSPRLKEGVQAPRPTGKPNSARIRLRQPNIITQAAVDALTANVYYGANTACWMPNKYLQFDPANTGTDADINIFGRR